MSNDLIARLRDWSDGSDTDDLCREAADEIEALRADAERYRKWREDQTGYQMTDMLIGISDAVEPAEVDAAIDAAIEAGKAVTP
jgi:predicted lactoylglutathione lyase